MDNFGYLKYVTSERERGLQMPSLHDGFEVDEIEVELQGFQAVHSIT